MKSLGVALFSDPKNPGDGFFSVGEEAEPMNGVHELSSDTVWVTNIRPYDFMKNGFAQLRHLRSGNYFRTDVSYLIREMGIEGDLAEAATRLAEVFRRTLDVLSDAFDFAIEDVSLGVRQEITDQLVPVQISEAINDDPVLFDAVAQSIQYNQGRAGGANFPKGSKIHSFVMPRSALASYLASLALPCSKDWSKVSFKEGTLRVGKANGRVGWSLDSQASFENMLSASKSKFILLDIDVREIDRRSSSYKSFGVGDRTSRHWACLEEVAELSDYAIIDIREGYACEKVQGAVSLPDMPDEFSFSRSLANEIISLGVASNRGKTSPSPWAALVRAVERIILGRAADAFAAKGLCVGSYGTGRVNLFLRSSEHALAINVASSLGLTPPYSLIKEPGDSRKIAFNRKLYYRSNLLDEAINITSFVDKVESDWLRMFVVGSVLKGESPLPIQTELDRLLDLPEKRRLKLFEELATSHLNDLPDVPEDDNLEDAGENPDNMVF